jgi:anti-anti-sigma factor
MTARPSSIPDERAGSFFIPARETVMFTIMTDPPLLRIQAAGEPPGAALRCAGEIDLSSVDCLQQALSKSIALQVPAVEVDLREVTFLDSSAIQALAAACHDLESGGRRLRVIAGGWITRLLRMVKMDCMLDLRTDG